MAMLNNRRVYYRKYLKNLLNITRGDFSPFSPGPPPATAARHRHAWPKLAPTEILGKVFRCGYPSTMGNIWKTMEKYMEKYGFMNFHGFSMVFRVKFKCHHHGLGVFGATILRLKFC